MNVAAWWVLFSLVTATAWPVGYMQQRPTLWGQLAAAVWSGLVCGLALAVLLEARW